jgi:hypothetical protein
VVAVPKLVELLGFSFCFVVLVVLLVELSIGYTYISQIKVFWVNLTPPGPETFSTKNETVSAKTETFSVKTETFSAKTEQFSAKTEKF